MKGTVYDLTQPFRNGMMTTAALGPFHQEIALDLEHNPSQLSRVAFATHIGTHFDAPRHFFKDGDSISDISAERLLGRAVVIEAKKGRHGVIDVADIEADGADILPGNFVFFNTGWEEKFASCDPEFYEGSCLSEDLAQWLVERRVGIVGIDTCSVDQAHSLRSSDFSAPIHRKLLGNHICILECLRREAVPGKRLTAEVLPMRSEDCDGAPVRGVATEL